MNFEIIQFESEEIKKYQRNNGNTILTSKNKQALSNYLNLMRVEGTQFNVNLVIVRCNLADSSASLFYIELYPAPI